MKTSRLLAPERRAIVGLASLYATRMLGLFMVLPVLALYTRDLAGATPTLVGVALGGYGLTQALLQIPFGWLSDRLGRKAVIGFGLGLFILGSLVAATADSIEMIILGRCLQGSGAVAGAIMALLADQTREEVRTMAMASIGMSIGVAFALAMVAGPLAADAFGLSGVFWLTAVMAVASLFVLWKLVPAAPRRQHQDVGLDRRQLKGILSNSALLRMDVSIFALHMILTACFVAIPQQLVNFGIAPAHHGWIYLPLMGLAFVAMLPLVIVAEKYRRMKPVFLGAVATIATSLLLLGVDGIEHAGLAMFLGLLWLFFVAFNLLEATLPSMISKLAPAGAKGTAMGVYSTSQFLGAFVGGVGGGWLTGHFGLSGVFFAMGLVAILWLAVVWGMQPPRHLGSEVIGLSPEAAQLSAVELQTRLLAIAGVEEALVVREERVAYLKVTRDTLDDKALARFTRQRDDETPAGAEVPAS
ncbi:MFS transporter [Cobetia sp. 4B]|uniref:MFS transporter n=1 Tax=Cobetia sp. 4B TaxID=2758724 RepID=UPI001C043AF8|nr:MFS transporter [Cobetia sp. 4B]MBR9755991.1 MFS transporter [Gammaproteobacteria bacterium]QWN36817.1 MFS transporter [Cobetia sp. 4B]